MRLRFATLFALASAVLIMLGFPASATPASPSPSPAVAVPTGTSEPAPVTGPAIRVRLIDEAKKDAAGDPVPVPGVTVRVADTASGDPIGEGVSNDMGVAAIAIPGRGDYTVTLDTKTLPAGVKLTGTKELKVSVKLDMGQNVAFPLNRTEVKTTARSQQLISATVGGIKFGLIMALAALGLSLIFGTTGLTNFAHGELVALGAIVAWAFNVLLGIPLVLAAVLSVIVGGFFGWIQDRGLWRPLRHRGTGVIAMMIVSIGFGIALRNVFQYLFGASTKPYAEWTRQSKSTYLGVFNLADKEIGIILVSILVIALTTFALAKSRLGKAMRAVSDNPALSASSGLRVDGVISNVWILGAALSALSGVLLGINSQVNFMMGYQLLLLIFAAVTLGGLGTIWGAIIGSLIIGIMMEVGPMFGVPTSIKEVAPMAVLIIILLVRPQGILGKAQRVG